MNRPPGVVVIAVLYWIGAFFLLFVGGVLLIGFTAFGAMAQGMQTIVAGLGSIGGILLLGFGAILAFIGYSLFQLKEWARITAIVFSGIAILAAVLSFISPIGMGMISRVFRLAVNAVIVWYLVQPQIKAAFR
ncbi:MAG TPA: hypothetical protein VN577_06200 [Terriglobales bacterium]|nr:hypothetical protein [Terriglobales bacterium]